MPNPSESYTYTKNTTATGLRTVAESALRSLRTKVDAQIDTRTKIRSLQGAESAFAAVTPSQECGWNLDDKAVAAIDGTIDRIIALPSQLGYRDGQKSLFRCESMILPRREPYEHGIEFRLTVVPDDGTLQPEQCPSKSIQTWIKPVPGNKEWCYEILE